MPIEVFHNETEVKNAIFESEREITNKILFTSAPKNHGKNSIKQNSPLPYYDSTYYSKVTQINLLKNKVQMLKSNLDQLEEEDHHMEFSNKDPIPYNNTGVTTNQYYNFPNDKLNYRLNGDLDLKNNNGLFNNENIIKADKIGNKKTNKNNDLHLYVIINNDTYPHKLADIEAKLSQNSHNYTEKNFAYDDLIREQIESVDNLYAKRKNQLANSDKEMKNNLKDLRNDK